MEDAAAEPLPRREEDDPRARAAAAASPWPVRLGLFVTVGIYCLYSSFGALHPVLWGHFGHHTAEYFMRARTSLRFHLVTPMTHAGFDTPMYPYIHHPIGYHHVYTLLIGLFGDHAWLGAVVPALTGLLVLLFLYKLCARYWSRPVALVAVAAYVSLPILTEYSILTDAMLPEMACVLAMLYGYLKWLDAPKGKTLAGVLVAIVLGGLLMWEVYFAAFFLGVHALAWALVERVRHPWARAWRASIVWLFSTGIVASATMAFHFLFVWKEGLLDDFLGSYHQRHEAAWAYVIERHRLWLDTFYGKPLEWIGVAWLALFCGRLLVGHARRRDLAPLLFAAINVLYIFLFAQGSSVHGYRVFFFSAFLALAIADFANDLHAIARLVTKGWPRPSRILSPLVAAVGFCAYLASTVPHAYAQLLESRENMGTPQLPGYNADYARQLFAQEVHRQSDDHQFAFMHPSFPYRVEFLYYLDRSYVNIWSLADLPAQQRKHAKSMVILDANPGPSERKLLVDLLAHHRAILFDHFVMVDLDSKQPELHQLVLEPEKPTRWWRWFVSHKYPPMRVRERVTTTGECFYAEAGVAPPTGVDVPPATGGAIDPLLCHHNLEVLRGHAPSAKADRDRIVPPEERRDVKLGAIGRIVGLSHPGRRGARLWLTVDKPPAGSDLVYRWKLTPASAEVKVPLAPVEPASGEAHPSASPLERTHAGYLVQEDLSWSVPPGRYRLTVEYGRPTPPAPPPRPTPTPTPTPRPAAPPTAPAATGKPPAAAGKPAVAPPAATVHPPAATGKPPAATGKPPAATEKPPAATGKPPAATVHPPVAATGKTSPTATAKAPAATGKQPPPAAAKPSPPPPVVVAPPKPPSPPPPLATADLGEIELK